MRLSFASVCGYRQASFFEQAPAILDGRLHVERLCSFADLLGDQHSRLGCRQLSELAQLHMVSVQQPLTAGLAIVHLEKAPVACINWLDLVRVIGGQTPEQGVALLHYNTLLNSSVVWPCRLSANKMNCSSGAVREELT